MHKKWKGYFTVEASFILPLVLFLYLLIILAALFLYCRCIIAHDFLLRGSLGVRFSGGGTGYGEVIYGTEEADNWRAKEYVEERMPGRRKYYPYFGTTEGTFEEGKEKVVVRAVQRGSAKSIRKELYKVNPIEIVRERRKG